MTPRADQYRELAAVCATVDYGSPNSVRENNDASDQMRKLVADSYTTGIEAVAELFSLLDDPECAQWLSFQLLELGKPPFAIVERCLSTIRDLAAGSTANAYGANLWLKEWTSRYD